MNYWVNWDSMASQRMRLGPTSNFLGMWEAVPVDQKTNRWAEERAAGCSWKTDQAPVCVETYGHEELHIFKQSWLIQRDGQGRSKHGVKGCEWMDIFFLFSGDAFQHVKGSFLITVQDGFQVDSEGGSDLEMFGRTARQEVFLDPYGPSIL